MGFFLFKTCTRTDYYYYYYPVGKVEENVGHGGWWLSVRFGVIVSLDVVPMITFSVIECCGMNEWWRVSDRNINMILVWSQCTFVCCTHIHRFGVVTIWCGWRECVSQWVRFVLHQFGVVKKLMWLYVESVSVSLVWSQIWCGCRL